MSAKSAFFQMIQKWEINASPIVTPLSAILFALDYKTGGRNPEVTITELENRITHILNSTKIDQDFFVSALVNLVTETLERPVNGRGELIINSKQMLESAKQSNNPKLVEMFESKIEELLDINHLIKAKYELLEWEKIVSSEFSNLNREKWENQRELEQSQQFTQMIREIPEEIMQELGDVPLSKLRNTIPFEKLKTISTEELRNILQKN